MTLRRDRWRAAHRGRRPALPSARRASCSRRPRRDHRDRGRIRGVGAERRRAVRACWRHVEWRCRPPPGPAPGSGRRGAGQAVARGGSVPAAVPAGVRPRARWSGSDERVRRDHPRPAARTSRSGPTTWSSWAAAATAWRPPTTSPPGTGSPTWRWWRPTTSARATAAATRPSSGPTTALPEAVRFYQHTLELYRTWRRRPTAGSCTRPRACCGWPTPSGGPAPSGPAHS